jgi:hypothetical protein
MSCSENDLKKLISRMKNIHKYGFLKKYKRIMEITKVSMQNSEILWKSMVYWLNFLKIYTKSTSTEGMTKC